jgi:hypothetical protein
MNPDFDDLIDHDVSPAEREELRAVHELLLSASPPPGFEAPERTLRRAPLRRARRRLRLPIPIPIPTRWGTGALGLAAAASAALALGLVFFEGSGSDALAARSMHGVGHAAAATALIKVGNNDRDGNRPLELTVQGLPALPHNHWYQLYLTRKDKPRVLCGIFQTSPSGRARVSMNAPADLNEYDGWIVVASTPAGASHVLLTTPPVS